MGGDIRRAAWYSSVMADLQDDEARLEDAYEHTRRSLIERLDDWQDAQAWQDFHDTYWRVIFRFSRRSGLGEAEAFDVVQETLLAVAKQARRGRYDPGAGSFKSWLFNLTRWRIADQFRKRDRLATPGGERPGAERRTATIERVADEAADADELWEAEWRRNASDEAMRRVKAKVSPRQFQIFDFYVIKEWTPEEVQRELGVSRAQVYLARHRVGALLKKELRRLEQADF